jgi:hypothetical protein
MTQENKDLLFKDLCARIPYLVKVNITNRESKNRIVELTEDNICHLTNNWWSEYKPYLFPISSITEEQYNSLYESGILDNCSHNYEYVNPHIYGVSFIFKQFKTYSLELIEWLNKNHFDYRGLISMGLAIDCTNLNIY